MGFRWVCIFFFVIVGLFCAPALAQDPSPKGNPEVSSSTLQTEQPSDPATTQPIDDSTQNPPIGSTRRRPIRQIKNREFDDEEKIRLLLSGHCDFPSKEDLLNTSDRPNEILAHIVENTELLPTVRMRAVQALAYFQTQQNAESLIAILKDHENQNTTLVVSTISGLVKLAQGYAVPYVTPFLEHPYDLVRFVTIESLKNCPSPDALNALIDQKKRETNRFFLQKLEDAILNHCKDQCP